MHANGPVDNTPGSFAPRGRFAAEAEALIAERRLIEGHADEALARLPRAFAQWRRAPWGDQAVLAVALERAVQLGRTHPNRARVFYDALAQPFAAKQYDDFRRGALIQLAATFDGCGSKTIAALRAVEPNPYWTREQLRIRATCYERAGLPLADRAWEDLERYRSSEPAPVVTPRSSPAPAGSSSGR
jgi:hypothetical protein